MLFNRKVKILSIRKLKTGEGGKISQTTNISARKDTWIEANVVAARSGMISRGRRNKEILKKAKMEEKWQQILDEGDVREKIALVRKAAFHETRVIMGVQLHNTSEKWGGNKIEHKRKKPKRIFSRWFHAE